MGKENFIHRILSPKPWLYALCLLVVFLVVCAFVFDKAVMPIVAREGVSERTVPHLEGLDSASAVALAKDSGFNVAFASEREYSDAYDLGLVMRQNPTPGRSSKPGRTIRLTVSDGLHQFTVPDLFDKNGEEAARAIEKAELFVGLTFRMPHPNLSKGKVVRTNPSEGSLVHKGDTVDIFLSSGPNGSKVELPRVTGLSESDALLKLRTSGFLLGKTSRQKGAGPADVILSQDPAAGTSLSAGTKINLVVSE